MGASLVCCNGNSYWHCDDEDSDWCCYGFAFFVCLFLSSALVLFNFKKKMYTFVPHRLEFCLEDC